MTTSIDAVSTDGAPGAIGPYSQAVRCGDWIYCSGQVALDPGTGEMVPGGVEAQTRRVFDNLAAVLAAAGSGLSGVVKCTVYLESMSDFAKVNEVYAGFFKAPYPARACVEAARLPKDALVEVDAVARVGDG